MRLRLAAALALTLGAAVLLAFLHLLGEGPGVSLEAGHLRDMKNRVDPPLRIEPVSFGEMTALPHHQTVGEYSALERRGVSLDGYVQHLMRASDGDFHLEIVTHRLMPGESDTAYVSAEITPRVRRTAPHWTYEALTERFRPLLGGVTPWSSGTRRVRISGWLLYDWQYDSPGGGPPGRHGERLTGWEIHPVTGIEVWDARTADFVEVPR